MSIMLDMSVDLRIPMSTLALIVSTAPKRYKVYPIPKKHGGERIIAQPSRELKHLQRYVVEKIISRFPIHDCAKAYRRGLSIRHNAHEHVQGYYIMKIDLKDFFNSIKVAHWRKLVAENLELRVESEDNRSLERILFWGRGSDVPKCLSVGSPASPPCPTLLCTILMWRWHRYAKSWD